MCFGAIYWARLNRVYYACTAEDAAAAGFDDTFIYNELRALPAERKIEMEPMMRDDAQAAFRAWLEYPGRVTY
jgi:guanine deaminase